MDDEVPASLNFPGLEKAELKPTALQEVNIVDDEVALDTGRKWKPTVNFLSKTCMQIKYCKYKQSEWGGINN